MALLSIVTCLENQSKRLERQSTEQTHDSLAYAIRKKKRHSKRRKKLKHNCGVFSVIYSDTHCLLHTTRTSISFFLYEQKEKQKHSFIEISVWFPYLQIILYGFVYACVRLVCKKKPDISNSCKLITAGSIKL